MIKKITLLCCAIVYCFNSYAQSILEVSTNLEQVTVYKAGASLEHTAVLRLPAGNHDLVVTGVSNNIVENSIQIQLPAQVTLLSVITAKDYFPQNKSNPKIQSFQRNLESIQKEIQRVESDEESVENTLEMVLKNNKVGHETKGTTAQELEQMATFYLNQQKKLNNELLLLDEKKTSLRKQMDSITTLLDKENHHAGYASGQIIVQVSVSKPITANLKVQYLSPLAGWVATYDLHASGANEPLKLKYKAKISQKTGIDWKNVNLKLSTGLPSQGGIAPTIQPWLLNYQVTEFTNGFVSDRIEKFPVTDITKAIEGAAPGIQVTNGGGQPGSRSDIKIRGNSSISSNSPLYVVDGVPFTGDITSINPADIDRVSVIKDATAAALYGSRGANGTIVITTKNKGVHNYTNVTAEQLNTSFDIDIPYTILDNNKVHTVMMKEFNHPAIYQHVAIPKLDPDAYLVASFSDFEKLHLIPGEANIIFENMYVGKTYINPYTTGDTLQVSMGRDKGIKIERKLIPESSITRVSGNYKRHMYEYEITIRNAKKETVQLSIEDQYPISQDKTIQIELLENNDAIINKETGILKWNLNIPPSGTKKLRFKYEVKYPKDKVVNL